MSTFSGVSMRVLGVDPGLTRCGLGVVEGLPGRRARMLAFGVVRTPATDEPHERLLSVQTEIDQWLAVHQVDAIAVERVFAKASIRGIMGTAQASAIPMLAAARLGLPLGLHTPSEVKAAVTGEGRAGKSQVAHMVTRILGLAETPKPADAADALALAVCHLWRVGQVAGEAAAIPGSGAKNRLEQAAEHAEAPNRLVQLHAEHRAATRAAAARTGVKRTAARVTGRSVAR